MKTDDEDFLKNIIYDRIVCLLKREPDEAVRKRIHAGEEVISNLNETERAILNDMQEALSERVAEDEIILYKNGICDGIRIMKWINNL